MRALRSALALLLAGSLAGCAAGGYGYPSYGSSYGGYPAYAEPGYGVAYGPSVSFGTAYPSYYYGGYPYWQQPYWHNWNNNGHWNNGNWNNGHWNNGNGHWNNGNGNWSNGHWNPPPNQGRPPSNKPPQQQWVNHGGTAQNPLLNKLNSGQYATGNNIGRGTRCRECQQP